MNGHSFILSAFGDVFFDKIVNKVAVFDFNSLCGLQFFCHDPTLLHKSIYVPEDV